MVLHEAHQQMGRERMQRALREAETDRLALQMRGQRQRRRLALAAAGRELLVRAQLLVRRRRSVAVHGEGA